jgi:hypothetical protein
VRPLLLRESEAPRVLYAAGVSCVAACERCGESDCGDCGEDERARATDEPVWCEAYERGCRAGVV